MQVHKDLIIVPQITMPSLFSHDSLVHQCNLLNLCATHPPHVSLKNNHCIFLPFVNTALCISRAKRIIKNSKIIVTKIFQDLRGKITAVGWQETNP